MLSLWYDTRRSKERRRGITCVDMNMYQSCQPLNSIFVCVCVRKMMAIGILNSSFNPMFKCESKSDALINPSCMLHDLRCAFCIVTESSTPFHKCFIFSLFLFCPYAHIQTHAYKRILPPPLMQHHTKPIHNHGCLAVILRVYS